MVHDQSPRYFNCYWHICIRMTHMKHRFCELWIWGRYKQQILTNCAFLFVFIYSFLCIYLLCFYPEEWERNKKETVAWYLSHNSAKFRKIRNFLIIQVPFYDTVRRVGYTVQKRAKLGTVISIRARRHKNSFERACVIHSSSKLFLCVRGRKIVAVFVHTERTVSFDVATFSKITRVLTQVSMYICISFKLAAIEVGLDFFLKNDFIIFHVS